ncbi:hypothetical protein CYMTET_50521, partial [Cymbomonas tetramitiformis]
RPLHGAAERGTVEVLRKLVEKGAEVDAEDGEGRTALTVALAFGQEGVARALLEAGAGVNAGTGQRPLHGAAKRGTMEVVKEFMEKGVEGRAAHAEKEHGGDGERELVEKKGMLAGGTVVDRKLALFERGGLTGGDVLHFVLRGAVLEVARNDHPFEEAFTELPAAEILQLLARTGVWPLHGAAERGMVRFSRRLVEKGAELDAEDEEGRTALAVALAFGQEAAARALLEAGAGVNAVKGLRPLHTAVEKEMVEVLRVLVEKGAEVDEEDGEGRTALALALAGGKEAAARALLEAGAGVNAGTGRRPLHTAVEKEMVEVLSVLLGKGAEVDEEDGEGRTALTLALAGGKEAAARALLEAGAGVNAGTGRRPLHVESEKGMVEMVRELAGKGAEVDAEDGEGRTALTVALAFGQEAAARALLEAGAGVNAGTGQRALHAAAGEGHGGDGWRPLHAVAERGMVETVRELAGKGCGEDGEVRTALTVALAFRQKEDGEGCTALTVALAFRQKGAARALLEAGAGVNAGMGQRPLHAAAKRGMEEMVRELLKKGADLEVASAREYAQNAGLYYFRGGYINDFKIFAGGTVVDKKLALFERGKLKAGDVLHFVLRGAVLEVALNDSPFEEAFTELPAAEILQLVQE